MTDPAGLEPGADDVAVVRGALDHADPGRLAASISTLGAAVRGVCVLAGATALAALVLGARAWGQTATTLAPLVLLGVAGMALPLHIARRSGALATAVAEPAEVLAQAQDLVRQARSSPDLARLASRLRRRPPLPGTKVGRIRRVLSSGRTISAVIGLAGPDPKRHSHLVPFTPTRLRGLWLAILTALWVWFVSAVVAATAALALLLGLF